MAKNKKPAPTAELDGVFVLKIALYVVLGSLWLKLQTSTTNSNLSFPVPVGLLVGLLFASHEHFQIDRKIEYAVLVLATLIGLIAPYGIFVGL